jgi:hypothetical protein
MKKRGRISAHHSIVRTLEIPAGLMAILVRERVRCVITADKSVKTDCQSRQKSTEFLQRHNKSKSKSLTNQLLDSVPFLI